MGLTRAHGRTLVVAVTLAVAVAACRKAPAPAASPAAAPEPAPSVPGATWDPWEDARSRGIDVRALGNEPGWFLEIDNEKWMRLLYAYGERQATTPVPTPIVADGATTYEAEGGGHSLRAQFVEKTCSDGMSDQQYPLTVKVTIDGVDLNGCGRRLQ
jgi:uncharacterized membrane protein